MKGKPHGKHWKAVMRSFGLKPNRCHSYETKSARKTRKFLYSCPSCEKETKVSTVIHNRIKKGRTYRHTGCGEPLEFEREFNEKVERVY